MTSMDGNQRQMKNGFIAVNIIGFEPVSCGTVNLEIRIIIPADSKSDILLF